MRFQGFAHARTPRVLHFSAFIMVSNASVGGTYQCTVENMAGNDSVTAVLNGEILCICASISMAIY